MRMHMHMHKHMHTRIHTHIHTHLPQLEQGAAAGRMQQRHHPLSPREALRAKVRERAAPADSAFVTDEMIAARTARHVPSRHFLTVIDKNFPPAALSRLPRDQRVAATAALLEAIASDVPEVNDEPGEDEDDTIAQTIE